MRISNLEACEPETLFSREVQDLLRQALDKMPDKTRRIFIMSRYEGKSYPTIAQETGLSVKSVEFRRISHQQSTQPITQRTERLSAGITVSARLLL